MPRKRPLNPGASPKHFFGAEVQHAREAAGMSQAQLGAIAGCDDSEVSRIEGGLVDPPKGFPEACDRAFPQMGGFFTRFWRDSQRWEGPFPVSFEEFAVHEAKADILRFAEHSMVPGLLQIREYAHAVLSTRPNTTKERVDELVEARMMRQNVLNRAKPPQVYALLDEWVLSRPVGSPEIMRDQLTHLIDLTEHPNVTVQVVPYTAGAHSGLLGAFAIAKENDSLPVVNLETAAEGETVEDQSIVSHVMLTYDALRSEALPRGASRDLMAKVVATWSTQLES